MIVGAGWGIAPRSTIYLGSGRVRPLVQLALPIRRLDRLSPSCTTDFMPTEVRGRCGGAQRTASTELALHGGVGLEWHATTRMALVAELGYERYPGVDTCLNDAGVVTQIVGLVTRM